ncbi:hypothetical protein Sya03_14190 [Spirilliplanes yamanashiensis]|uniref:Uncharacterized protein n=1 Tax=Spirilliplanes yamanashiensis TaxID=42233 RepID=A0A8J4DHE6_9ACTN|nr:hypothetical protein Sya03_14190 [Spirilliplanes yamanashiensis]
MSSSTRPIVAYAACDTRRTSARDGTPGTGRPHSSHPNTVLATIPAATPTSTAAGVRPTTSPAMPPPARPTVSTPSSSASVPNRCRPCKTPASAPATGNGSSANGSTSAADHPDRCSTAVSAGAASATTPATATPTASPSPTDPRSAARPPPVPATCSAMPVCALIAGTTPMTSNAINALSSPNAGTSSNRAATMVSR